MWCLFHSNDSWKNLIDRSSRGIDQLSLTEINLTATQLNTHLRMQTQKNKWYHTGISDKWNNRVMCKGALTRIKSQTKVNRLYSNSHILQHMLAHSSWMFRFSKHITQHKHNSKFFYYSIKYTTTYQQITMCFSIYLISKSQFRHRPYMLMIYCPDPGIIY